MQSRLYSHTLLRMAQGRRVKAALLGAMASLLLGGCDLAQDNLCFSARPAVIRPSMQSVSAHLSSGQSGKILAEAIFAGDLEKAAGLIDDDPKLLGTQVLYDPDMDAPPTGQYGDLLTFAVASCNADMLGLLLSKGAEPNGVQKGEALTLALLADSPVMAEILLQAGASSDAAKLDGKNIMKELFAFDAKGGVMTLLRHGADVNASDAFGFTPIHDALSMENYEIALLLHEHGAALWQIGGAGALPAWQLTKPSVLDAGKAQREAKAKLLEKAKASGLPWPPPPPPEVRKLILSGKWPTPELEKSGLTIHPNAKQDIITRFGKSAQ
ncbi:ankyrin repeat domain-containing protein [Sphingorhabdus arenilitoris]|uniref:Ankyrin repeat domain-containing protein n=1 Tax=Sphingorhabdus arenilitoris TaxID=1490041 RepID=A0ABV8RI47_9SPHN